MRWLPFIPLIAAMGIGATLWAAPRPGKLPRYLLTDREAFILHDPELIAAPPVTMAVWSPDSRSVLAVRQEDASLPAPQPVPSGALDLVVWTRGTGRSRVIWQRPAGMQQVAQIKWLPHTQVALMVLGWLAAAPPAPPEPHKTLFRVDAARGIVQTLGDLQNEQLLVSPAQPLAVLENDDQHSLRVIRTDGSIGPPVPLPERFQMMTRWSPDGGTLYLARFEAPPAPGLPPVAKWQAVELRTGAVSALTAEPEVFQEKALPVRLKSTTTSLKEENTSQRVTPLWLESTARSEQPRALVCADGDAGSLAPDASAVLYVSQGTAWVAPLTRLPREPMLAQIRTAQRAEVMSNAKQIGLALAMYAQDYDETFPPADGHAMDVLRPYVRSDQVDEVFSSPGTGAPGFTYLYTGGPLKTIDNPATTELGYLAGPGGRAVIYADGHVKWQGDAKTPGAPAAETRRGYFR